MTIACRFCGGERCPRQESNLRPAVQEERSSARITADFQVFLGSPNSRDSRRSSLLRVSVGNVSELRCHRRRPGRRGNPLPPAVSVRRLLPTTLARVLADEVGWAQRGWGERARGGGGQPVVSANPIFSMGWRRGELWLDTELWLPEGAGASVLTGFPVPSLSSEPPGLAASRGRRVAWKQRRQVRRARASVIASSPCPGRSITGSRRPSSIDSSTRARR